MNNRGIFITFEGGEGCGKSTQVHLLAEKLKTEGKLVHLTREPGGSEIAEKIRGLLKSSSKTDSITELLLMFAARREHFVKKIFPLLQQGYMVISDRFYDSSIVYQGILKKVSIEQIMYLKNMTIGDFEPDLTIILDISSDEAKKRVTARKLPFDTYDCMSEQEYDLIRKGFKKIADIFSFRTILINATGNESIVFTKVQKAMKKFLYR